MSIDGHTCWPQNHLSSPGVGGYPCLSAVQNVAILLIQWAMEVQLLYSNQDSAHECAESLPIYAGPVRVNPGGAHCSPIEQLMNMVRRDGNDGTPVGTHYWL